MKTKSFVLSCFILFLFIGQAVPQESSIPENLENKFRQDFWMTSKTALVGKYLIKVLLPRSYFKSDTTK